jgi:hypothetical protein
MPAPGEHHSREGLGSFGKWETKVVQYVHSHILLGHRSAWSTQALVAAIIGIAIPVLIFIFPPALTWLNESQRE